MDRSAEFERRYQSLLADEYKPHAPNRLRSFLVRIANRDLKRAQELRGVDETGFKLAVSSVEKAWQLLDMLEDMIGKKGEAA